MSDANEESSDVKRRDKKSAKCPYCYFHQKKICPEVASLKPFVEPILNNDNMFSGLRNREVKAVIETMKNKKNPNIKRVIDEELEVFKNDKRKEIPNLYWAMIGEMYDKIVVKLQELADKEEKEPSNSYSAITTPSRQIILVTTIDDDPYMAELDINKDLDSLQSFHSALSVNFLGVDLPKYAITFDYWRCNPSMRIWLMNDSAIQTFKEYVEQCEKEGKVEVNVEFIRLPQQ